MLESNAHASREQLLSVHRAAAFLHTDPHAVPSQVAVSRSFAAVHIRQVAPQLSIVFCVVQVCPSLTSFFTLPQPSAHTTTQSTCLMTASYREVSSRGW